MRRISSACLLQTMRFDTYNDANPQKDFEVFCKNLDNKNVRYVIEEKFEETDGTLVVKIKKQYNAYKTDGYIE